MPGRRLDRIEFQPDESSVPRPARLLDTRRGHEEGTALVIVVLASGVVVTLSLLLALLTRVETEVASNALEAVHTLALAEGAAEHAAAELAGVASWNDALTGGVTSTVFDGARGVRVVAGRTLHLDEETARVTCGRMSCVGRPWDEVTAVRPWGRNNPMWRVFASGRAVELLGDVPGLLPGYAVVWVADDASENDADELEDGGPPVAEARSLVNPGAGVISLKVVAWGPRGSRRELDIVVERANPAAQTGILVRSWREVRGAEP